MAAGKFNMQKASGGVASITVADGTTNTDLVLPESGTVATTTDVDTRVNEVVGQLSTDYYQGAYGISWDYATDTYIRTGAKGYTSGTTSIPLPSTLTGSVSTSSETRPKNIALLYCIKY